MFGLYLINKPTGITSHDVVSRLRRLTGERTIGHAGTLDPMASGLMILAIGRQYTKKISEYVGLDKKYSAEITLGQNSTTYDAEGELTPVSDRQPSEEEVQTALNSFVGEFDQMPPIYSAKKIQGQNAYKLARQGKEVVLEPKRIKIYEISLTKYSYPKIQIEVKVSSGTYIRSLAFDIGQKLGTGAYLTALRRTEVGDYSASQAMELEDLSTQESLKQAKIG